MTNQERKSLYEVQAILSAIDAGRRVFFNITKYQEWGLVREHGRTIDNNTRWVLTQKGRQIMNFDLQHIK